MQKNPNEVLIAFIAVTAVIVLLVIFIVIFSVLYQRRQLHFFKERELMKETFQRELLQTQLETQNQTLLQVAEELHDHIGQLLTVAVIRLNALEMEVTEPDVQQSVQQTQDIVRTIIDDVRALAKTLDQNTVRRFGLLPSLALELERIQRTGRVRTELITVCDAYSLDEQAEIVLLRMVQEAVNNALKHADAQTLTVMANYQPDTFILIIADDGRGFEMDEATARSLDKAGAGLQNLHRRAGLLGGTCTVVSQPNEGTRVEIRLPRYHTV